MEMDDISMIRMRFTWFRPNERACSRLDRILVSEEWLNVWGESTQYILKRDVSDHYPILLKDNNIDWGPKPSRDLDCWWDVTDFEKEVSFID